jgi:hypothetical protein
MNKTISSISKQLRSGLTNINDSKYFAGLAMIMLNIGSRYVTLHISKSQEELLKNTLARQLLIFSIAWLGSRDIITSLILTSTFIILSDYLLNEESQICILPKHLRSIQSAMDTNEDGVIDETEINQAIKLLEKAKKTKKNSGFKKTRSQYV